jgi:ATP-dependent RNA helicase DeaD
MAEKKTFEELGLDKDILGAISEMGFETPTPVQAAVIPRLLNTRKDFVGLAQTGTGKTAAFGLPVIQQTDTDRMDTQVLILCPTRELCLQITRDLTAFASRKKNLRLLAVYGGSPIETQIRALKKGVHIIAATPGRMHDLLRRKRVNLQNVQHVVLDEADEMLNMGFQEDLEVILGQVPDTAQTLLFSATMPRQVASIAGNYMHDPEEITVGTRNAGAENVTHVCYTTHAKDRYRTLKRIADFYPAMYGIVFCRTRVETQVIADKLMKDGYDADSLHGDLSQVQRDRVMDKFRTRGLQMLVATDVAARGLDVTDLTHIINYNLPDELESYTHRSGRTGRAGKKGVSVVIVHMREKFKVTRIERIINKKFEHRQIPSGKEVCEAQLIGLIGRVKDVDVDHATIGKYLPEIKEMLTGMSQDELIKHFVSLEFNRFLDYYRNAPDLNVDDASAQQKSPGRKFTPVKSGFTKLFLNIGTKDNVSTKDITGLVNDATPGKAVQFGNVEVMPTCTFFEVENKSVDEVVGALNQTKYRGRGVRIEPATSDDERGVGMGRKRPQGRGRPGRDRPPNRRGDRRGPSQSSDGSRRRKPKPHRKGGK